MVAEISDVDLVGDRIDDADNRPPLMATLVVLLYEPSMTETLLLIQIGDIDLVRYWIYGNDSGCAASRNCCR